MTLSFFVLNIEFTELQFSGNIAVHSAICGQATKSSLPHGISIFTLLPAEIIPFSHNSLSTSDKSPQISVRTSYISRCIFLC